MRKPGLGNERLALACIVLGFVAASLVHAQAMEHLVGSAAEARSEMASFQQARLENAEPNLLLAPFYSIAEGHSTRLILLNKFSEEVDFGIRVQGPGGSSFPLTWLTLTPREITVFDLKEDFGSLPKAFQEGSLILEYFGDPEMAQGWVVISSATNDTEFPLINPGKAEGRAWRSFWDLSKWNHLSSGSSDWLPRLVFYNPSNEHVMLTFDIEDAGRTLRRRSNLLPGDVLNWSPPKKFQETAQVTVRHSGQPGAVTAVAFLRRIDGALAHLPLESPESLSQETLYDSAPLPSNARHLLSIVDSRDEGAPQQVDVRLLDLKTGSSIESSEITLTPGRAQTIELHDLFDNLLTSPHELRLQVSAAEEGVLPHAWSLLGANGEHVVVDVPLYPRESAHGSGAYPLPALDEHDVTTTVINLGSETAELTAHLQFSHGEYALAPVEIPAGASIVFDFRQIAQDGVTDLLGRTFEANDQPAFFYWSSRRGSHQLVARTLVRGDGRRDAYGFNCTQCCPEVPWGDIIPSSIAFNIGAVPSFQAVEYVSTCNGLTGPFATFPASRSFSPPVNWTGSQISSVDFTNQSVSFTESVFRIGFDCIRRLGQLFGIGDVVVDECLDEHGPEDYDPRGSAGGCPAQSASCNECFTCCEQLQDVGDCRCDELPGQSGCTPTLLQESCRQCKTLCLGSHDIESCTLPLTCQP